MMYYYSHHIGDFDRATRHLTRIERSVYLDLLFVYYETELQLPLDVAQLCRKIVARGDEEKEAVIAVLDEFFTETPTGYFHDRCEEEIAAFKNNQKQASAAGKASAVARAERRRAALDAPGGNERRGNGNPTDVERTLNGRTTDAQRKSNGSPTEVQRNGNQPVTSNHEPVTENHQPGTINPEDQPLPAAVAPAPKKAEKKAEPGTGKVWAAYASAYWSRYGVEPVRNASVNGQLSQMVKRLGPDDAEQVAAFYLTHRNSFYVGKMHGVGPMLADCEKLRTEWATQTQMTSTKAQQADKTQTNMDAFGPLIAAARARELAEEN